MQNMTLWPNMENTTFYDFITFIIDFVELRFLFQNSFHSFLKHIKYDFYDFKWPYSWHSERITETEYKRNWTESINVVLIWSLLHKLKQKHVFFIWFLVTTVNGRPKPEICPLLGRLRWTLFPKERYGNFPQWPWIKQFTTEPLFF